MPRDPRIDKLTTNSSLVEKLREQATELFRIAADIEIRDMTDVNDLDPEGDEELIDELSVNRASLLMDLYEVCDELVTVFAAGQRVMDSEVGAYRPPNH